ncbi:hypothetical protein Moror_13200 [Moniliophthora roreri MCA 2997]|uniref:Uncharacterized protein n=2 Tax=Moniliophthora roreri TaxID=221103 RepID=V2X576_MONRO|nr:hypothetical protein Moror_13200 [Moniliophthora roreri MCA 2997]KAI3615619.1 hypothetical protein WG66_011692 [Moniliophthora roreri]
MSAPISSSPSVSSSPLPSSSSSPRDSWEASPNETHAMLPSQSTTPRLARPTPSTSSSVIPSTPKSSAEFGLIDDLHGRARHSTSTTTRPSPLNPNSLSPGSSTRQSYLSHRASFTHVKRIPSEESRALSMYAPQSGMSSTRTSTPSTLVPTPNSSIGPHRASMILYRLAADELDTSSPHSESGLLPPPRFHHSYHAGNKRDSITSTSGLSTSGDSFVSLASDSKYPVTGSERGLVAYPYDPDEVDDQLDDIDADDGEDWSFEDEYNGARWNEKNKMSLGSNPSSMSDATTSAAATRTRPPHPTNNSTLLSSRGITNLLGLFLLIIGLLSLFIVYPVVSFYHDDGRNALITGNVRINSTGQAMGDGGDIAPGGNVNPAKGVVDVLGRRDDPESESRQGWSELVASIDKIREEQGVRFARYYE